MQFGAGEAQMIAEFPLGFLVLVIGDEQLDLFDGVTIEEKISGTQEAFAPIDLDEGPGPIGTEAGRDRGQNHNGKNRHRPPDNNSIIPKSGVRVKRIGR